MTNFGKKSLIILIGAAILIFLLYHFGAGKYFTLERFREYGHFIDEMVVHNYVGAVTTYISIYILFIASSLPVVPPFTLLGGYIFGMWFGFIYALISSVVGSTISYLLFRFVLKSFLKGRHKKQLVRFKKQIKTHGYSYLLTMHFMMIPFFIVNMLAAIAEVSFITFLWTTIVGSMPIVAVYAFAGSQFKCVEGSSGIFNPYIILLFLLLIILALLPLIIKRVKGSDTIV